jgi:ketosteroid isomerase-like protein
MASDPNVDFLKGVYDAWSRGDYSRDDMLDPSVEFVTGSPEPRTYRGREGALTAWRDFLSAWQDFRVEAEDVIRVSEDVYVVLTRLKGRGKESQVPAEGATANVIRLRDGLISRIELHWDRDEAFEAARVAAQRDATRR